MADNSKIEWTDATWSPIRARSRATGKVGWHCVHASDGCRFCYAESINKRLGTGLPFKPGHERDIELFLDETMLTAPLRWKRPRMIFVCSMTDLFADFVSDEWIDRLFAVMALCPQHTFQVLTKRPARMRAYFNGPYPNGDGVCARIAEATLPLAPTRAKLPDPPIIVEVPVGPRLPNGEPEFGFRRMMRIDRWPLRNVWLGVSAEDQDNADQRIPDLLATPAAIRFVSAEPLLGPIDFQELDINGDATMQALAPRSPAEHWREEWAPEVTGTTLEEAIEGFEDFGFTYPPSETRPRGIDWVIVGGESGPKARPMHPDWPRSIRDQCDRAGTALFFKQHGEWMPGRDAFEAGIVPAEQHHPWGICQPAMARVGKHRAGRLLDGVEHNAMPEVR